MFAVPGHMLNKR